MTSAAPRTAIAIMAAGKGTRLKSKLPKVLHEVGGKPLLAHVIAAAAKIVPVSDIYVIIGHEADRVREALAHTGVGFVLQREQRGTGHALMMAREALSGYSQVIVLSGDAPLIQSQTIEKLRNFHIAKKAAMTLLTAVMEIPLAYGRIIRKGPKSDEVKAIVEFRALSHAQQKLCEINAGFYAFDVPVLYDNIDKLSTNNAHGEYYLTDMAAIFTRMKKRVVAIKAENVNEVLGGNTRAEIAEIDQQIRMAKCKQLMNDGVTIFYPQSCVIDCDVEVGSDTVIEPFVQLLGKTKIGSETRVHSYCVIRNTEIGDGVVVFPGCVIDGSRVQNHAMIGPYAKLRPGSNIGEGAKVGSFVETKKVNLGKGSKVPHLTYLGDADIGEGVNIGAGTITCNYDGVRKHKTIIEDGVFVGSDSTLVAPVKIGKGAYIGAATCVTEDVPPESLALGRARQVNKEGWVRAKKAQQKAARES